jgi:hypothetical protein
MAPLKESMTVGKLIAILSDLDLDAKVVVAHTRTGVTHSVTDVGHGVVEMSPLTQTPMLVEDVRFAHEAPNPEDLELEEVVVIK